MVCETLKHQVFRAMYVKRINIIVCHPYVNYDMDIIVYLDVCETKTKVCLEVCETNHDSTLMYLLEKRKHMARVKIYVCESDGKRRCVPT